jgi:hypothetical protein
MTRALLILLSGLFSFSALGADRTWTLIWDAPAPSANALPVAG